MLPMPEVSPAIESEATEVPAADLAAFAAPQRPTRKAWKEKAAAGKGRTGVPIPPPAEGAEAKAFVKKLAAEATEIVTQGKELPASYKAKFEGMSSVVRAHILSYLGEDVERARADFAAELLSNCREVAQHIMTEWKDYPEAQKLYWFTALCDKSQALSTKAASSATVASVNLQINTFGDGSIDKNKLIDSLLGKFTPEVEAEPVKVEKVG